MTVPALECPHEWGTECGCRQNPCWPRPDTGCCASLQTNDDTPPERVALIERMLRVSVDIMHAMSGRQFGACPVTVRPCRDSCRTAPVINWGGVLNPYILDGVWFNGDPCGKCTTSCSCTELCEVTLPGPVERILEVRIDGELLAPGEYRVDHHRKLVRQYGMQVVNGFSRLFTSAQTGPFKPENRWCDITPAPDDIVNVGPVEPGGCYPSTENNPTFSWAAAQSITATYDPNSPDPTIFAFTDEDLNFYTFAEPAGTVIGPGESITSVRRPDGQFQRVTVVSGSATRYEFTDYGLIAEPGTVIRMERFEQVSACWPTCQDLSAPAGAPDTWTVTYLPGDSVPAAGLWSAGLLACELMKACAPDESGPCRLPSNVQSVVREGVSIDLAPLLIGGQDGTVAFGRTGIPEVDLWLASVNPYGATSRPRVYSPDLPRPRQTTWPCT